MTKQQTQHASEFDTKPFNVGIDALKQLFTVNSSSTIGVLFIALALSIFTQIFSAITPEVDLYGLLLRISFIGLSSFVSLIGMIISLRSVRGKSISLSDASSEALENFLPYIGYAICLFAVIAFGSIFLIIPGIIFSLWYGLVLLIRIDEGPSSIRKVFAHSRQLVKGRLIEFIAINIVAGLFSGFGILGPATQHSVVTTWYDRLKHARSTNKELPPVSRQSKLITAISFLIFFLIGVVVVASIISEINKL